ncbi:DUF2314 domain-containing protein [Epibacterium sp. SM1969]|uniref:DUF2314 domain-containing protein n=1 Tax=Tritonibacter aquimaris TaxID=2663379 RepID=A0A844AJE2_9RHOB|nr:DUF2314 domain-containing protein [Tritonibacter aquimaris]MQY41015.1 DUF2314 domain-containing protein [Tritonibacter aquimaris]
MLKSIVAALALTATSVMTSWAGDPLYTFGERHPEMEQAIVEARITLPKFLSAVTQPDNSLHPTSMLKVSVPVDAPNTEEEIIWVDSVSREGSTFIGQLANAPNHMPGLTKGSQIQFEENAIFDWSIWGDDGKLYGNYTTRVMLPELDLETAQSLRNLLSEPRSPW